MPDRELRILMTNFAMRGPAGTQMFIHDLALEFKRLGHAPAVYSPFLGITASKLQKKGVPAFRKLKQCPWRPDIIHGHHYHETLEALRHFREVPAVFVSHAHDSGLERPPADPRIMKYFGPSRICVERLVREGIPREKTVMISNFVDTGRFLARGKLPEKPLKALVFSNYARRGNYLPVVVQSCKQAGISLDIIGARIGRQVSDPENFLGKYDIVFAKAKAAMEAMAVGSAVILCDYAGLGPMVTSGEFSRLQEMNFGFEAMNRSHTVEGVIKEIERFDSLDARRVRDLTRSRLSLRNAAAQWVEI